MGELINSPFSLSSFLIIHNHQLKNLFEMGHMQVCVIFVLNMDNLFSLTRD